MRVRRHLRRSRRRNAAAHAVRSPAFRPKVFRDRRKYHRPSERATDGGTDGADDPRQG